MRFAATAAVWGVLAAWGATATAHDTWVQTNVQQVRTGDVFHVDLMLGNHGNEHRDFKLNSKITLAPCTLEVVDPAGERHDLKGKIVDLGFLPKEGYWSARHVTKAPGLYTVAHTLDVNHGPTRAIKSGKAFVLAGPAGATAEKAFSKPLGHAMELVPQTDPARAAAGREIRVQVLQRGKPLAGATVAFIPRGAVLAEGTDPNHEKKTDADGMASYTPAEGNWLLAVVHHSAPEEKGEGYEKTHYGATLTWYVPQVAAEVVPAVPAVPAPAVAVPASAGR